MPYGRCGSRALGVEPRRHLSGARHTWRFGELDQAELACFQVIVVSSLYRSKIPVQGGGLWFC